ncbi:F-box domain-containing protein [Cladophialophora immunda]|nr:F-box domain-containing protein [Cladophialophora immunda]
MATPQANQPLRLRELPKEMIMRIIRDRTRPPIASIMATPQENQPLRLLDLPNEIIMHIIRLLDGDSWPHNRKHVRNFRRTCKRVCELSEFAFFRFLHSLDVIQSRHLDLMLNTRPERYNLVRTLVVFPRVRLATVCTEEMICCEHMLHCLTKVNRLQALHVLGAKDHDRELFQELNFKLKHTTFNDLRECTLISYHRNPICINSLLKAPKLTTLKVSCAFLDPDDPVPPPNFTALEYLALLDFQTIDAEKLSYILSVPAALQTLEFSIWRELELRNDNECKTINDLVSILATHQPELKTLKIHGRYPYSGPPLFRYAGQLDFIPLTGLKELAFAKMGRAYVDCFINLPKGLETLRLHGEIDLDKLSLMLIKASKDHKVTCPPNVKVHTSYGRTVIPFFHKNLGPPDTRREHIRRKSQLMGIHRFMAKLSAVEILVSERNFYFERRIHARAEPTTGSLVHRPYEVEELFHPDHRSEFELFNRDFGAYRNGGWEQDHPITRGLTSAWD